MATDSQKFMVRDPQGNVYGPADVDLLAQWIAQGRIVPGMHIAPPETGEWAEVSTHPALAHLFSKGPAPQTPPASGAQQSPPAPTAEQAPSAPIELAPAPTAAPVPTAPVSPYPVTPVNPATDVPPPFTSTGSQQNVPALVSLGSGILAVVFGGLSPCLCICSPFAVLAGLASLISGGIALSQMKNDPSLASGRGQAITGMALGVAGILLTIVLVVVGMVLRFRHP